MMIRKLNAIACVLALLLASAAMTSAQATAAPGAKGTAPQSAGQPQSPTPKGSDSPGASKPTPVRLRVFSVRENLITLTWLDSLVFKGKYVVYRSDAQITDANFASAARLGEVPKGMQTYTDTPPDTKPYFYAVLALADDGTPYQSFVPKRNVSVIGISVGQSIAAAAAPGAAAGSATSNPAFVTAITAKVKGEAIEVTYKASPKSRLVLYRGTAAILGTPDLLDATLVAAFTDKDGAFIDYPVPGVDYYYALLGEEDLKAGRINITAGSNSTTDPIQVKASTVATGFGETPPAARTTPLPYFLMEGSSPNDGVVLPQDDGPPPPKPLSLDTEKAIVAILSKTPKVTLAMPAIKVLGEELSPPSGGEDYALSLIVSDKIASKDWPGAVDQLGKYLSLNRGPKAAARARFYLGEAHTNLGSTRDAFFEFLSARDFYPVETKPWIEYVLSLLSKS
jgi:hypothetical protein